MSHRRFPQQMIGRALILLLLVGCSTQAATPTSIPPTPSSTPIPTCTLTPSLTIAPTSTPTLTPITHRTNADMPARLAAEARQMKEAFVSPIYPAPKPLPSKFNSVFIPLPSLWREALLRVDELKAMGFNSVHFGPIMTIDEDDHPHAVGEDLVRFYVNEFHRNGMHVILTTNPAGPWAQFSSEEREDWSERVKRRRRDGTFVDEYVEQVYAWAEIAQELDVAAFIPANEMQIISTNHAYLSQKAAAILPEIRKRYSGKVGFSIQGTGDLGPEGNWAPTYWEYDLTHYDFILSMGTTARLCDVDTRDLCRDHIERTKRADINYLESLALKYDVDEIWFGLLLFNGSGNYWEPNNGDPYTALTPQEAAEYADVLLGVIYDTVSGVSPVYDTGFMVFEDPLPDTWLKYFSPYTHPQQGERKWQERDLYRLEEAFFPEWDGLYALPWGDMTTPGYSAVITSTEAISISGIATYEWPRKIHISDFNFEGNGNDVEIRLADDRTDRLLVNIARLMDIGNHAYENAELTLYWPDHLQERMFNQLIIYDVDNRQVLGGYKFLPP